DVSRGQDGKTSRDSLNNRGRSSLRKRDFSTGPKFSRPQHNIHSRVDGSVHQNVGDPVTTHISHSDAPESIPVCGDDYVRGARLEVYHRAGSEGSKEDM